MPFAGLAFAYAIHVGHFVLLLSILIPGEEHAFLLPVHYGYLALLRTVGIPGAAGAVAAHHHLLMLGAVVVKGTPYADLVTLVVIFSFAEHLPIGMPPSPVADMDTVLVQRTRHIHLIGVGNVCFFIMDLGPCGESQQATNC